MGASCARERFEEIFASGRKPVGAFVSSSDISVTQIYGTTGYDWVAIDCEHGMIDLNAMRSHIHVANSYGMVAIVRVLDEEPSRIQQALDAGAHGIIVPKVSSGDQARLAYRATRYGPGGRGMCPSVPNSDFDTDNWAGHSSNSDANVLFIPLIETAEGVRNIQEIVAVPGIDYVFFGLADLSQDMGLNFIEDAELMADQLRTVAEASQRTGTHVGAPAGFGLERYSDFVTLGADLISLQKAARQSIEEFRAFEMTTTKNEETGKVA
jgi:2-keto-3-deoxy-L-rhamnonate aldolase RhmA